MAANIKEKRLSEDSTASEASVSASVESADGSGVNTDDSTGSAPSAPPKSGEEVDSPPNSREEMDSPPKSRSEIDSDNEDEYVKYLEQDPRIKGRYTDADPDYANDRERLTPPLVVGYNPRVYNRGGGNSRGWGGGGRGNYQNRGDRQGYGNHGQGQGSSYGHQQQQQRHFQRQESFDGGSQPMKRKNEFVDPSGGSAPKKRPTNANNLSDDSD